MDFDVSIVQGELALELGAARYQRVPYLEAAGQNVLMVLAKQAAATLELHAPGELIYEVLSRIFSF